MTKENKCLKVREFVFFSPTGKKFRSRTELERYVGDTGIEIDPQKIDFTVRGKKAGGDSKPKPVKKKMKPAISLNLKEKTKSDKKNVPSPTKELKQLKTSPKKAGKTLSQKLVVKMKFAAPFKITKSSNTSKKKAADAEDIDEDEVVGMNHDQSDLEDDLVKIKLPPPPPPPAAKRQKGRKSKTSIDKNENEENESDQDIKSPPLKKRRESAEKKSSEKVSEKLQRRRSSEVKVERRKSANSRTERKKSTESKSERRKSADKGMSTKKHDAVNRELQVFEKIRASSRSARYKKKQEELKVKHAASEEESEDDKDGLGKYEPYEEYDNEGQSVLSLFPGFTK